MSLFTRLVIHVAVVQTKNTCYIVRCQCHYTIEGVPGKKPFSKLLLIILLPNCLVFPCETQGEFNAT